MKFRRISLSLTLSFTGGSGPCLTRYGGFLRASFPELELMRYSLTADWVSNIVRD